MTTLTASRTALRLRGEVQAAAARAYPPLLRDAGVSGQALVEVTVDGNGRVDPGTTVVVGATRPAFGETAREVMARARFTPARLRGGGRTAVRVALTVEFGMRTENGGALTTAGAAREPGRDLR